MRWLLGFCLGTAISAAFLSIFTWANGTPLPALGNWVQVAAYPTGSAMTTFEVLWIIYFASFVVVFSGAWLGRKASSRKGHTGVRPPRPGT